MNLIKDVFDVYNKEVFNYVYYKVFCNKELAEDLTQEVFIKIIKYNTTYDPSKSSLRTWIYIIARNTLIDYFRKNDKNIKFSVEIDETAELSSPVDMERAVFDKISYEALMSSIKNLKDFYRELIILKYVNCLNNEEIALIYNKSNNSIKVAIHRATEKLKILHSKYGR